MKLLIHLHHERIKKHKINDYFSAIIDRRICYTGGQNFFEKI